MDKELKEIYERLLERNYQEILFGDLKDFKKSGRGYIACCPFHDDKNPSFLIYGDKPGYFCYSCHVKGDWVRYLMDNKGLSFLEAKTHLAKEVGIEIKGFDKGKWEEEMQRTNLLDAALEFFEKQLWTEKGKETLKYLKQRGYSEDEIKNMELGYFPGCEETTQHLKDQDFSIEEIYAVFKWINMNGKLYREEYKVVIPYKDVAGRLIGFYGRLIRQLNEGEKEKEKYKPFAKAEGIKNTPFLMWQAKGEKEIIVVEGFFDALIPTQKGVKGVIATGNAHLNEKQVENIVKYGEKRFILAFDNDPSGLEGTERAIDLLCKRGIKTFVAIIPEEYKDPDELVRAKGIEAFKKVIKEAKSWTKWKAGRILSRHDLETDRGERDALDETIAFEEKIKNSYDREQFKGVIREHLDIQESILNELTEECHRKKAEERLRKKSERIFCEALRRVREDTEITDVIKTVEEKTRELKSEFEKNKIESSIPFEKYLEEKYQRDNKRENDELLGYRLDKFKDIARKIDGIQPGFYLIGGETNIGKTAFLTNLFLDLLDNNPETKGIYFSLDDNKDIIIERFVSILTGMDINEMKRKQENVAKERKIIKAYEKLKDYARSERLDIKDLSEITHIDSLETEIREWAGDNLFVAIDGLYNLEIGKGYGGIREENIERAQKVKSLVDIYRLPIICTGELRKRTPSQSQKKTPTRDDLMETGKFAYNATVIWLLYPENIKQFEETPEQMLRLKFEKNKLSSFTGYRKLKFIKAQGIIKEDI